MWEIVLAQNSMNAESPFSDYTVSVVVYVLLVGVLVTVLLLGGFLILNLGLLSKRQQDRTGSRNPSDVGVLKDTIWPEEPSLIRTLPAEELDDEIAEREKRAAS